MHFGRGEVLGRYGRRQGKPAIGDGFAFQVGHFRQGGLGGGDQIGGSGLVFDP
jgi:hypothetical protein